MLLGDINRTVEGYHQCRLLRRDTKYIEECSVLWGDINSIMGDAISRLESVKYVKGYHQYYGDCY